jgi:hypothetical protein
VPASKPFGSTNLGVGGVRPVPSTLSPAVPVCVFGVVGGGRRWFLDLNCCSY